jgi:molybdenum cofactor biosynthesis enzyme MoaA
MSVMNSAKNRNRDAPSFANINLLGKCNVDCFFCLGKDITEELKPHNQLAVPFHEWNNFDEFLRRLHRAKISKVYITGQNTDSLLYKHLGELIEYLHVEGFMVGLRTNGYLALRNMSIINRCDLSVGYSIHSVNPVTTKMILGRDEIPDWPTIIPATRNPRVSVVLNRCNEHEFFDVLKYTAQFPNLRYIQIRRTSTDTRADLLAADIAAYERVYTQVSRIFGPPKRKFVTDAEVYEIYGQEVIFWRTVKTSVNSWNYFTDGTISEVYFVVEGYLQNRDACQATRPEGVVDRVAHDCPMYIECMKEE